MQNSLSDILNRRGQERRINYDLSRFKQALKAVGSPEKHGHAIIVGGTNGKGDTTLLLSAALSTAGHRVATLLSPHLYDPTERFLLNLSPIEEARLTELAQRYEPTGEKYALSYFEFLTLLFFLWAQEEKVDFLITEVGLGGKLDATNVTEPIASVLTNVGLDHQAYLGDTKEEILADKLHITRSEGLLFTGLTEEGLKRQAIRHCDKLDAIYYFSHEVKAETIERHWLGQELSLNSYRFHLHDPSLAASKNAALAFLVCRILFPKIGIDTLQRAFSLVKNPGRFEIVQQQPRVLLSAAHNPHGLENLMESLRDLDPGPLHILCGFSLDKPYVEMYKRLSSLAYSIELTQVPETDPADDYRKLGSFELDPIKALRKLFESAQPGETVLVTGSIYLIGAVRRLWHSQIAYLETPATFGPLRDSNEGVSNLARFPTKGRERSLFPPNRDGAP